MRDHLSYSAYKAFRQCEAAAAAEWRPEKKAFLEGKFFEAALTGEMGTFLADHPDCLKRDGELKAEFVKAEAAANRLLEQPFIAALIERCERQKEVKGEIAGVPFLGYVDLYDPESGDCYDIKYVRSFESIWNPDKRVRESWYYAYGYDVQAAIYDELLGGGTRQHLIAATKETVPDIDYYLFGELALRLSLLDVIDNAPHIWRIVNGEEEPERCGHCDYCKMTKTLVFPKVINGYELD